MDLKKTNRYYRTVRNDLIGLIPKGATRILEIGCGAGQTGKNLKERGYDEVVGVEINRDVALLAAPHYSSVITGDVEKVDLPYEKGHFDCILYGDVLEHLIDPWRLLREHNRLLRMEGVIVASIPNVRYYRVVKRLFARGRWDYEDAGILDRTHLRFFTLSSIEEMVTGAGFEVATMVRKPSGAKWLKGLNRLLRGALADHLVRQYVFLAVKRREPAGGSPPSSRQTTGA